MKNIITYCMLVVLSMSAYAQDIHWTDMNKGRTADQVFRQLTVNESDLADLLLTKRSSKIEISLPLPNGEFINFELTPSSVMSPGLASKFPGIKTYNGLSKDGKTSAKIDYSSKKGFHAMIFTHEGTVYIDPNNHLKPEYYNSYYRNEYKQKFTAPEFIEEGVVTDKSLDARGRGPFSARRTTSGTELRKYRLAVSADNEYSAFHGDTKEEVMAAIVTTINRVTGIYEIDVAVTLELIDNNDLLIFLDPETDPFDGAGASAALSINQEQTDNIIGTENYDIGHIFTTGSGGLAGLGVVCSATRKAQGTTGTNNPTGDPFDVDYVAHEIGHQFAGNHTFNGSSGSCSGGNRNGSTAYEPGSGTTIMAYAGICNPQNVQSNSDAFFHAISLEEIVNFTTVNGGNSCAVITESGNTPPVATVPDGDFFIPNSTPFVLEGSATDADGDNLTYSWEQFDLGPTGAPDEPEGNAPLFRAFLPTDSPIRQFPQNSDLINGTQTMGELLPEYQRTMNFRFVVRDNNPAAGGIDTEDISFTVSGDAGPFVVTSQSSEETYIGGSQVMVEWDVANTDQAPVNCSSVSILLSTDGGQTFPTVLKSNTANDGSEAVSLPVLGSTNARIKVASVDNIFFNINSSDFIIDEPTEPDFVINLVETELTVCSPEDATFEFTTQGVLGFADDVSWTIEGLPSELNSALSNSSSAIGDDETLVISNIGNASSETVSFTLTGTSGSLTHSIGLTVNIINDFANDVVLNSPADGADNISTLPQLIWESLEDADTYTVQVSASSDFSTILEERINITDTSFRVPERLSSLTEYFWRVQAFKTCDHTTEFVSASFTTGDEKILDIYDNNLNIEITSSGTPTVTSVIEFDQTFEIIDVNVVGLDITHSWISDLTVTLIDPSGVEVELFASICDSEDNILANFDSDASTSTLPCPPVDSLTYQPSGDLSTLVGNTTKGEWTIRVSDGVNQDGGTINAWGLEVLYKLPEIPAAPSNLEIPTAGSFVALEWTDNSNLEDGFILQRSSDLTNWETLDSLGANVTSFTDLNPSERTAHYRVAAFNISGTSEYSEPASNIITGVNDFRNDITIAPNPGLNELFIQNRSNHEITQISLIDLSGKEVLNVQSTTTINTSSILRGIYLVKVLVNNRPVTFRWVKK